MNRQSFGIASHGGCRVYWGTHGCCLHRGHDGPHLCTCTFDGDRLIPHMDNDPEAGNVGRPPYYGPDTRFYGEDAATSALPLAGKPHQSADER